MNKCKVKDLTIGMIYCDANPTHGRTDLFIYVGKDEYDDPLFFQLTRTNNVYAMNGDGYAMFAKDGSGWYVPTSERLKVMLKEGGLK